MAMRAKVVGGVLLIGVVVAASGQSPREKLPNLLPPKPPLFPRLHRLTRPHYQPGLPVRDYVPYQGLDFAQPTAVVSQIGILLPREVRLPDTPPPEQGGPARVFRPRVKYYQLDRAQLTINHCSIGRVAVSLHESGEWIISLRADQNPWMTGPRHGVSSSAYERGPVSAIQAPIPELERHTNDLRRNQFVVWVRAHGAHPLKENIPEASGGKPVLFQLRPEPFWVQRGQPYDFWAKGWSEGVRQFFDVIDRMEIEFNYR